jgi:hypothetical protein
MQNLTAYHNIVQQSYALHNLHAGVYFGFNGFIQHLPP